LVVSLAHPVRFDDGFWQHDQVVAHTEPLTAAKIGGALLTPHVQPLLARLRTLLSGDDQSPQEIERRIRIIRIAARPVTLQFLELAATATLQTQAAARDLLGALEGRDHRGARPLDHRLTP